MKKRKRTTKAKEPKSTSLTSGAEFSTEKLESAFFDVFDLMQRCLLQDTFLTLGETGLALDEKRPITGDGIDIGIEKRYLTKEVRSTLRTFHPESEITDGGMAYIHFSVPVRIKFINRNYKFFKHPESAFYLADEFRIPNPFRNYYKARFIIQ